MRLAACLSIHVVINDCLRDRKETASRMSTDATPNTPDPRTQSHSTAPIPEEERMNPAQSVQVARAVGASADAAVEQQSSAEVLKVSTRSRPSAVAGAIAGVIRES